MAVIKESDSKSRSAILDAAERVFGHYGYEGGSMRLIAEDANVAQALLHYHYKTKENLYVAIFERRASIITAYRTRLLDDLFASEDKPGLEQLLEIMLTPLDDIFKGDLKNLDLYVQMVAAVGLGNDSLSRKIRESIYDPIAQIFVAAFTRVIPELTHDQAVWAYLFTLSARQQAYSLTQRPQRLGATARRGKSRVRHSLQMLVTFAAAGIRALTLKQDSGR